MGRGVHYSTPNARRRSPAYRFTLDAPALAALAFLAPEDGQRSAAVRDALVERARSKGWVEPSADLMEDHCGMSNTMLARVAKEINDVLQAWEPRIVRKRKHARLLSAILPIAVAAARRELGGARLTPEQKHVLEVLTDSHLSTWETRAREEK